MSVAALPFQILVALAVYVFDFSDGPAMALALLAVGLAGARRVRVLGVLNILVLLFSTGGPRRVYVGDDLLVDSGVGAANHPHLLVVRAVCLGLAAAMIAGATVLARKKNSGEPLVINLVFLALLVVMYAIAKGTAFGLFVHGTAVYFAYFFWFVCYSQPNLALRNLPATMPFWAGFTPWQTGTLPRGTPELETTGSGPTALQAAGAGAMVLGGLITLRYFDPFRRLVFGFFETPSPVGIGLYRFVNLGVPPWVQWGISFLETALFLLHNAAVLCVTIGIIRAAGFQVPFDVQYPWRARSYGDFLRRMFFYYGEVVMNFFPPLFGRFKNTPWLHAGLSVAAGIFVLNFILEIPQGLDTEYGFFFSSLRILPFIVLILAGLLVTEKMRPPEDAGRWRRAGFLLLCFFLFSVAYNSLLFFKEESARFASRATAREFAAYMGNFIGL